MLPRVLTSLFLTFAGPAIAGLPGGSIAIYSDGTVEKLIAIEGEAMRWEDDRKRQYLRSPNPVLPVLERT